MRAHREPRRMPRLVPEQGNVRGVLPRDSGSSPPSDTHIESAERLVVHSRGRRNSASKSSSSSSTSRADEPRSASGYARRHAARPAVPSCAARSPGARPRLPLGSRRRPTGDLAHLRHRKPVARRRHHGSCRGPGRPTVETRPFRRQRGPSGQAPTGASPRLPRRRPRHVGSGSAGLLGADSAPARCAVPSPHAPARSALVPACFVKGRTPGAAWWRAKGRPPCPTRCAGAFSVVVVIVGASVLERKGGKRR